MKLRKLSIHAVLIGTTLLAEGSLERRIGAHPDIDLVESFTTREDAHEGVDELLSRRVFYALLDDVDAREGLRACADRLATFHTCRFSGRLSGLFITH